MRESVSSEERAVRRFELRERTQDGSSALQPFKIPDTWDDELLWRQVGDLVAIAQDDTNQSETLRRAYFLCGFDEADDLVCRSPQIRFQGERDVLGGDELGGVELEAANPKGLLAQHMRHTEAMVKTALQATHTQIVQLAELNARLMREKSETEEKRLQLIIQTEELLSERHRRDLEVDREKARDRRMDQVMQQVQALAPALMTRLLPASAVTASPAAVALATSIKGIVADLPPEKMSALADLLGPEKSASLGELFSLMERIEVEATEERPRAH